MRKLFRLGRTAAATAVAVGALASALSVPTPAHAFGAASGVRLDAVELRLLSLINAARTSRGIPALALAPGYTDLARRWAADQARRRTLSHNPNLARHVSASGGQAWTAVAENVGSSLGTRADALFNSYMASSGHRANILNRKFRYLGIGWAEMADGYGYNTQVFVDAYDSRYGRTREPAYGGVADRRSVGSAMTLADFESGWDQRLSTAVNGTGLWSGGLSVDRPGAGDQAARFTVREAAAGSGGWGELRLRDALDLSQARTVVVRMGTRTGTGRPVNVDVWLKREWGDAVRIGTVAVGGYRTYTFTLPAGAKTFRNQLTFVVSRWSLTQMSPSSRSTRWATLATQHVSVTV